MENDAKHIKKLLQIHRECLQTAEEQIARVGMNPAIGLLQERQYREEEISKLQIRLEEISGELEEFSITQEETQKSASQVREELKYRLIKLKAFRDTAIQIRDFVTQNKNSDPDLSEKFSYLYAEVAPHMIEVLKDLAIDNAKISENIMKFIDCPPDAPSRFIIETNQGLSLIQMALRRHEIVERE